MSTPTVSARDDHPRARVPVLDTELSYVDTGGSGNVVFLHGNPTSSYLWRNVIEDVRGDARCLAPDLVGMGDSGKPDGCGYRFVDHARYLDAWFDALELEEVVLVVHDWGSALGFHWANRHRDRVRALAYMEALVRPMGWDEWPEIIQPLFRALRSEAGEQMIIEKNLFVERVLPGSVLRELGEAEMDRYRAPFIEPEHRRPTLCWPREIPLDGEPADVVELVDAYAQWLQGSQLPKLFVNADPGAILVGPQREFCRTWPNQTEVTVAGSHFIQEDSPAEIGAAIRHFLTTL